MRGRVGYLVILLMGAMLLFATGCGVEGEGGVSTTGPDTTLGPVTTVAADTRDVAVYFSRNEKICVAGRPVTATDDVGVASAALAALFAGPTADEAAGGMASSIPQGTALLALEITGGVASVDLSSEYASGGGSLSTMMRLAEVVFTLTQFEGVLGVELEIDGVPVDVFGSEGLVLAHPMTRADFEALSPAILVESPLPGATVVSPVWVRGTSNTFEATSLVKIVDQNGAQVGFDVVTATSGSGTRGTFDAAVVYAVDAAGPGAVVAYEESAEDGSVINEVTIPVQLTK